MVSVTRKVVQEYIREVFALENLENKPVTLCIRYGDSKKVVEFITTFKGIRVGSTTQMINPAKKRVDSTGKSYTPISIAVDFSDGILYIVYEDIQEVHRSLVGITIQVHDTEVSLRW